MKYKKDRGRFCVLTSVISGDIVLLFGTKSGAVLSPQVSICSEQNHFLTDVTLDENTAFGFNAAFQDEISHFVDCILNQTNCRNPAADGVVLMKILDAVYASAKAGHEVRIE